MGWVQAKPLSNYLLSRSVLWKFAQKHIAICLYNTCRSIVSLIEKCFEWIDEFVGAGYGTHRIFNESQHIFAMTLRFKFPTFWCVSQISCLATALDIVTQTHSLSHFFSPKIDMQCSLHVLSPTRRPLILPILFQAYDINTFIFLLGAGLETLGSSRKN